MKTPTAGLLLLAALASCGDPAPAPARPAGDPFAPAVPASVPTGEPLRVTWGPAPGDAFRTTGTLGYHRAARGRMEKGAPPPDRTVDGSVQAHARVEGVAGGTVSTVVEGRLETVDRSPGAGERRRVDPFTLRFEHDARGGAVHRTIRLDAPADLKEALEVLAAAWTDRFRLPSASVRVGEGFAPEAVLDLDEAMRRPLYFLFLRRAQMGEPVDAPIEGRLVVEARETFRGTDVLRTRFAATHAFEGDTDPPPVTKDSVRIGWRAAVEGTVRVALAGGWPRTFDMARRRRVSYRAADLDYVVEFESRATLETSREGP